MSKIRVLVADDHSLVREGISAFLKYSEDIEVVAEAADGIEAIEKTKKHRPDIVLLDISMPRLGGYEAALEIKKFDPGIKILVLTQYDDKEYITRFLKAGASGYLLKRAVGSDLVTAIRAVKGGETYLYPAIATKVVDSLLGKGDMGQEGSYENLTDREKQLLKLIAEGYKNKQISNDLCISVKTVEKHRANLMEKLDLHNVQALTTYAIEKGLVSRE